MLFSSNITFLIITILSFSIISGSDDYTNELPKPLSTNKLTAAFNHKPRKIATTKKRPVVIEKTLNQAGKEGLDLANKIYDEIEPNILKNKQILENDHPAALLSKFGSPTYDNTNITKSAYAVLYATKAFRKRYVNIVY